MGGVNRFSLRFFFACFSFEGSHDAQLYHITYVTHVHSMAKSIRSKRRQRVLAIRRQKYREIERKKCWEHQLRRQAEKTVEMVELPEIEAELPQLQQGSRLGEQEQQANVGSGINGGETAMDRGCEKLSKRQLRKLAERWSARRKQKKMKRLGISKKGKSHS